MDIPLVMTPGEAATCRICRSEGSYEEPLFRPCRCSGSIGHVHQECLVEWLSHSQKKHCELCKTPFRFTKLYDAQMPSVLPWTVFFKQALLHLLQGTLRAARALLVVTIWMVILPWIIRWSWRWMFWFADAGWARDIYFVKLQRESAKALATSRGPEWSYEQVTKTLQDAVVEENASTTDILYGFARNFLVTIGMDTFANTTHFEKPHPWKSADASIFSSVSYISSLTPYPAVNRILLDIFEGQLITCTVILAFILVFLIREWVVQQQPIVNRAQQEQELLRLRQEQAELHRNEVEFLQQQRHRLDLLDQARDLLNGIEETNDGDASHDEASDSDAEPSEQADALLDTAEATSARPRMPERGASSQANRIRRLIEDAGAMIDENGELLVAEPNMPPGLPPITARPYQSADLFMTNAGPDARLNIEVINNTREVAIYGPQPDDISNEELEFRLNAITVGDNSDEDDSFDEESGPPAGRTVGELQAQWGLAESSSNEEQAHADAGRLAAPMQQPAQVPPRASPFQRLTENAAAAMEQQEAARQGNAFFRGPQAQHGEQALQNDIEPLDLVVEEDPEAHAAVHPDDLNLDSDSDRRIEDRPKTSWDNFFDWFWGDITVAPRPEPLTVPDDEQLMDENVQEAPFVPVHHANGHVHIMHEQPADPEVLAAAQEAGLDAEQIDDADDFEGIMELIGLRGPLTGLLQTSLFCLLLVVLTVAAAVVIPYVWGKLVLSFIGSPLHFMVTLPLQIVSFLSNLVVDMTLFIGSWFATFFAVGAEALLSLMATAWPRLEKTADYATRLSTHALAQAQASGGRLQQIFASSETVDPLGINAGFLGASIHSHAALQELQGEIRATLSFLWQSLHWIASTLASHDLNLLSADLNTALKFALAIPAAVRDVVLPYQEALLKLFDSLKNGSITITSTSPATAFDPALMYWSANDRALAVCAGYAALAFIATIYVAADTPITRSAQQTEKMIRDSLRQAGGVFKVILIISIEMLVFPFYCGLLLDLAFLPLFASATMVSRVALVSSAPYLFCFVHWFIGTCYMFHFALFVGMCRKILRKGVLWFIRDPDDPTFHPVRDVLERNVVTQLRKIAFSALVYGALVILCLGGVIWSIGKLFRGIFPIHWTATESTVEFPLDLLLYNFITPLVVSFFKPSEIIHAMYGWWFKKCARMLRLSHFLFDERRTDEEGYFKGKWTAISRFMQPVQSDRVHDVTNTDASVGDPSFEKDGRFVLTPCNDQYRPPKTGELVLYVNDDDMFVTFKDGTRDRSFSKVYVPPFFKGRVALFMVCLWIFSAFCGLCATLLPLALGRSMLTLAVPGATPNDIYAYSLGVYAAGGVVVLVRHRSTLTSRIRSFLAERGIAAGFWQARKLLVRAANLAYVYGLLAVIIPLILSMVLEAHFMAPLHTWFKLHAGRFAMDSRTASNSTLYSTQHQQAVLGLSSARDVAALDHTIHIAQDLALGNVLFAVIAKSFFTEGSRAAEAIRRIVINHPLKPNPSLATRYLLLPVTVLTAFTIGLPFALAGFATIGSRYAGYQPSARELTLIYRFSFPALSASALIIWLLVQLGKATTRWRSLIRDEVYLVGERLHNFGEKRPPLGTRSVMRAH